MPESTIRDTIQAALMAADDPLSVDALLKLFDNRDRPSRKEVSEALEKLEQECEGRSFSLVRIASGWRYQIDQDYAAVIGRLWEQRPPRYSQALLETLALIVYRQPMTRGEIEQVRGVAPSTNIMQTLTERNWVRVVGYKQVPGRPALYGTTREFLDYFGLKSLKELPPLPEPRAQEEVDPQLKIQGMPQPESDAESDATDTVVSESPEEDLPPDLPEEAA
ncbi:MAG: SMC-Scp complex subunit ScpB [Gammaproteobacteria bacterium]|nr:SMC-Scp complex subunit ScpB [Gammaproteobacteria bacterium]